MAITDPNKIDFISTQENNIFLTISDHLDWEDPSFHLQALQTKLNSYIAFIESGEIYETYPYAKGRRLIIEITSPYGLSKEGTLFLKKATSVLSSINIELNHRVIE